MSNWVIRQFPSFKGPSVPVQEPRLDPQSNLPLLACEAGTLAIRYPKGRDNSLITSVTRLVARGLGRNIHQI